MSLSTIYIVLIIVLILLFLSVLFYLIFGKKEKHEISFDIGTVESAKVKITRQGEDLHIELTDADYKQMPLNPDYVDVAPENVSELDFESVDELIRKYAESEDEKEKLEIVHTLVTARNKGIVNEINRRRESATDNKKAEPAENPEEQLHQDNNPGNGPADNKEGVSEPEDKNKPEEQAAEDDALKNPVKADMGKVEDDTAEDIHAAQETGAEGEGEGNNADIEEVQAEPSTLFNETGWKTNWQK